jgi:polyhydroxybutyrate depolymerase
LNLAEDDVQFFRDLVAEVSSLVSVDPARAYVIGCQAADVVAAIGLVDPGILTEETLAGCSPARPVPGIEFVGTGDVGTASRGDLDRPHQEFTPLLGWLLRVDADYGAPPLHAWGGRWTTLNGCDPVAEQLETTASVGTLRYINCQRDGDVVVHVLEGMGHQWPGGKTFPSWLMGAPNDRVKAMEEVWVFFEAHPLETEQ